MKHLTLERALAIVVATWLALFFGPPVLSQVGGGGVNPSPNDIVGELNVSGDIVGNSGSTTAIYAATGGYVRAFDLTDVDYIALRHDGTSARVIASDRLDLESLAGDVRIEASAGSEVYAGDLSVGVWPITPESGTFEATWENACTTTPSQTFDYMRLGNIVTLYAVDGVNCTSDATVFSDTTSPGLPASLTPAQPVTCVGITASDNGTFDFGRVSVLASGTMTYLYGAGSGLWTATGTKDIAAGFTCTYILNNP